MSLHLPAAEQLVGLARVRLAGELERLPPLGSPALRVRLRSTEVGQRVSPGALVHLLRLALRANDRATAHELFELLLKRIENTNRQWARRTVARTPGLQGAEDFVCEELHQELALYLWSQLAYNQSEKWELFFHRALEYAQQHTASSYMEKGGYWIHGGVKRPARGLALLFSALERDSRDDEDSGGLQVEDGCDHFSAPDLADLRALVLRLPVRERVVIVMRYWQGASQEEIARALGGVSTRMVRTYLRQAYKRLHGWYEDPGGSL